ncbi:MAG TPA: tetratricopeptide repeat protein, partial [Myxococcales bacterium]|nr:tetratricopeptide repeat protein [Myxococcales bacterium]
PPPMTPARGAPVPTPPPIRPKPSQLQAPSAMAAAPKAESVLERAISLERRGEVDGAIHVLKRAITQVKEPAALCNKLALILVNQRRDFHQAEELLNKAIELEPDNAVYQQNLFKVVGLAAERRENRSSTPSKGGGGFFSKLLKK